MSCRIIRESLDSRCSRLSREAQYAHAQAGLGRDVLIEAAYIKLDSRATMRGGRAILPWTIGTPALRGAY